MHMRVIVSISVLMLFASCEWWAEVSGKIKIKKPVEDIKVVAERAVNEVSRATGKSADEVKALSKDELDKIAEEAKSSTAATFESTKKDAKKKSELIDEIKQSTEKLDLAFKSLVGAGYRNATASLVLESIKTAKQKLGLAGKLEKMIEDGNKTMAEVRRVVGAFGDVAGYCMRDINEKQGRHSKSDTSTVSTDGLKDCVRNLMDNVVDIFVGRGGAFSELRDAVPNAPDRFKGALSKLCGAVHGMNQASMKVKHK
ncbi:hypothetical protein [Borrelia sp. P9F1]|uniref:hypothetical protein n=1 Tax=Borrelia sp. P9F1 TaxID=3058374 RepID=UPI002649F5B0|nr:hypothetical protein [Borrelia sp. P9F1]WKC58269.1 hypothetical protein QYZ68_03785 [Borrelia sp. P9F1]